jgi:hypothetical protein
MADNCTNTSDKAVWALLGAVVGAGGMYVLAKENVWKPNPVTYVEKTLQGAQRRAEEMALSDYAEWVGRKAWFESISGFDSFNTVHIDDTKVKARVNETDANDVLHWNGPENLDPYWNIEILDIDDEEADRILGLSSPFTDAPSIHIRKTGYGFVVEREPDTFRVRPA